MSEPVEVRPVVSRRAHSESPPKRLMLLPVLGRRSTPNRPKERTENHVSAVRIALSKVAHHGRRIASNEVGV